MRLLVATPLYPPDSGGPATYAALLERLLPEAGVDTALALFSEVRRLPKLLRHTAYAWMVYRRARHADVVLALDPVSTGLPAMFAARVAGKPFLVKVVGDYSWEQGVQRFGVTQQLDDFVREARVPFPVRMLRFVQSRVARSARQVIVPSEYLKRIVSTWGIDAERIVVIPNAFEHVPGTERVSQEGRYVLTAGRLVPWKGMTGVIEAMDLVHQKHGDVSLLIAGDGPERAQLETAASLSACPTTFTGALTHDKLMALMRGADVFVLNSSYEGLSHLLLESLSSGVPTVATRVGGNPEVIRDGENGLLVPVGDTLALADAIARLVSDDELSQKLSEEAKKAKDRFSTERMVGSMVSLLEDVV